MKANEAASAPKVAGPAPVSAGARPHGLPEKPPSLGADAAAVRAVPQSEAEKQRAAVEAVKAAQAAPTAADQTPLSHSAPKRPFFRPWGISGIFRALGKGLRSDHPLAAFSRAALRFVPLVGAVPAGLDVVNLRRTLSDSRASTGQKVLAGIRAAGGVAAVATAAGMFALAGAVTTPAWVALGVGAGAAFLADVALSRWRTGHW